MLIAQQLNDRLSWIIHAAGGLVLFTGLTIRFLKEFLYGLWLTSPLLLSLAVVVTVLGQAVGKKEGWSPFESFYWSFITATTVGYGDVRPTKRASRILAIAIALVGFTLTGIFVAVAVHAATVALTAHDAAIKASWSPSISQLPELLAILTNRLSPD